MDTKEQARAFARKVAHQWAQCGGGDELNIAALGEAIGLAWPTIKEMADEDRARTAKPLRTHKVTLREEAGRAFLFECEAEDCLHAHEQARNAYPAQEIVAVVEANSFGDAIKIGTLFGECTNAHGKSEAESPYVRAAMEKTDGGDIQVDPVAVVSESDSGAYVQAWMWVAESEADEYTNAACIEEIARLAKHDAKGSLAEYVAWAEDLVSNFAEEINDIGVEQLHEGSTPRHIEWLCKDGKTRLQFRPSDALEALRKAAGAAYPIEALVAWLGVFLGAYGEKLDRMLASIPIPDQT